MSLLGNILWVFIGGGLIIALEYLVAGLLLCATIVGIPFGLQCFKLAGLSLVPFGKEVVNSEKASGLSTLFNIVWLLTAGLIIGLSHVLAALLCAVTIIGIPFAKQHIKLASLAIMPFGKEIRSGSSPRLARA